MGFETWIAFAVAPLPIPDQADAAFLPQAALLAGQRSAVVTRPGVRRGFNRTGAGLVATIMRKG